MSYAIAHLSFRPWSPPGSAMFGRDFLPAPTSAATDEAFVRKAVGSVTPPERLFEAEPRRQVRNELALAGPLLERIAVFAQRPFDVHGHSLPPISPLVRNEAIDLAMSFAEIGLLLTTEPSSVAMPSVHRTTFGGVQFEWHRKGVDLEIVTLPSGQTSAFVEVEDEPFEVDLTRGIGPIEAHLRTVLAR